AGRQRAPRTGTVVSRGRVPEPPECPADEAEPAGAAQADVGSTAAANSGTARRISAGASRLLHQSASPVDALAEQGSYVFIPLYNSSKGLYTYPEHAGLS